MNGKTNIDPINQCSAALDIHTYGCRWANVTTWGNRLIRVEICGVWVDVYWSRWHLPRYVRHMSGGCVSWPFGLIYFPLPLKKTVRR